MSTFRGTISFLGIVEPYMPDRVLRQFGRVQGRPLPVIPPTDGKRPDTLQKGYHLVFDNGWNRWESEDAVRFYDVQSHQQTSDACPGGVTADYLQWYQSEFRGYVLRSTPRIEQPAPIHPPPAAPVHPPPVAPVHQAPPAAPSLLEELQAFVARGERPELEAEFLDLLRRRRYIL